MRKELAIEYSLIDAAAELGTGIYITGCNYVDSLSYYENCSFAIAYFEKLIAYGKEKNIKIATYNCRWNNFVCNAEAYKIIHGYLKDLYIKYDTSHCINAGGDYLQETRDWGKRFIHVHLKGAVKNSKARYMTTRPQAWIRPIGPPLWVFCTAWGMTAA